MDPRKGILAVARVPIAWLPLMIVQLVAGWWYSHRLKTGYQGMLAAEGYVTHKAVRTLLESASRGLDRDDRVVVSRIAAAAIPGGDCKLASLLTFQAVAASELRTEIVYGVAIDGSAHCWVEVEGRQLYEAGGIAGYVRTRSVGLG